MTHARLLLPIACLVLAGCGRPAADEAPFLVGLCHVSGNEAFHRSGTLRVNSVRNSLLWRAVETAPDEFRMPERYGGILADSWRRDWIPLVPLSYGNPWYEGGGYPVSRESVEAFSRFAKFSAEALTDSPAIFEIWNEWNLGIGMGDRGPGNPAEYVALQRAAYAAIKGADPSRLVLGGGMAGVGLTDDWTLGACRAGMLEHLDGLAFHPYSFWMPDAEKPPERGMMHLIRELEWVIAPFPRGGEVPFYVTEIGWPTNTGPEGVTLDEQAQYAARAMLLLRAHPRVRGAWWFNLRDMDSNSGNFNHHFGLFFSDGTPKPSFFSFRDTARFLREVKEVSEPEGWWWDDAVRAIRFATKDGRFAWVLWTVDPGGKAPFQIRPEGTGRMTVELIGSRTRLPVRVGEDGLVRVTAGNMPVIVRGVGENSEIEEAEVRSHLRRSR